MFLSTTSSSVYILSYNCIIACQYNFIWFRLIIQNPPANTMKLRRNVHADWKINITAQSPVKIDTEMLEHSADGNLFSVKGNPIIGEYDNTTFNNISVISWQLYTRVTQPLIY